MSRLPAQQPQTDQQEKEDEAEEESHSDEPGRFAAIVHANDGASVAETIRWRQRRGVEFGNDYTIRPVRPPSDPS